MLCAEGTYVRVRRRKIARLGACVSWLHGPALLVAGRAANPCAAASMARPPPHAPPAHQLRPSMSGLPPYTPCAPCCPCARAQDSLRARGVCLQAASVIRQDTVTALADANSPQEIAAVVAGASGLARWGPGQAARSQQGVLAVSGAMTPWGSSLGQHLCGLLGSGEQWGLKGKSNKKRSRSTTREGGRVLARPVGSHRAGGTRRRLVP